jgi:uncharacterized protein DUF6948
VATPKVKKPYVVIRTYSAGVHFGILESRNGQEVVLSDARRLWSWVGAKTLHEVASAGIGSGSKVSVTLPLVELTQAIEVLHCTADGEKSLRGGTWA